MKTELINDVYEPLIEVSLIKDPSLISSQIIVKTTIGYERKKPMLGYSFIPIRKNALTNSYERLVSFDLKFTPAKTVNVGDEFEVKTESKRWVIKVTALLDHRVQYSEAIKHYTDITPPEELDRIKFQAAVFHTGKRLSKVGRPTKKDKRDLDGFMGETP